LFFEKENILSTYLQGGQGNLSAQIIKSLVLPLPSYEEQTKIAAFLSAIDRKIDLVSQQLDEAKAFKKGLLQQMFV
jgi:type I restriction enzyme S subunit